MNYSDTLICSEDFYPPSCHNTNDVLKYLENRKIGNFAISRGYKSIIFKTEGNRGEVEVPFTKVIDTLGAGDFLHGAFCYYFLESQSFEMALKKASQLATFTCQIEGTRKWINV